MARGRVLVTGAGGFVGRHVMDVARAAGLEVVAAEGDLRDADRARSAVAEAQPSGVVHLAAVRGAGAGPGAAHTGALAANAAMSANVLGAVAELAPDAVVLLPGSAAQYGHGALEALAESAPLAPVSAYGAAKSAIELAALQSSPSRVVCARTFNLIGPGQPPGAPVASWARQLAEAEAQPGAPRTLRTGRLDVVRDLLDVRDAADAYLALLAAGVEGPVNVCSGHGVLLSDVLDLLLASTSTEVEHARDPGLERIHDPPHVVGDLSRLQALTGWAPRRTLERSVVDVLDAWREQVRSAAGAQGQHLTSPVAAAGR